MSHYPPLTNAVTVSTMSDSLAMDDGVEACDGSGAKAAAVSGPMARRRTKWSDVDERAVCSLL